MLEKVKVLWAVVKEKTKDLASKLPKSNPDVTVEWKDGQPEFKNKKDKKTKK